MDYKKIPLSVLLSDRRIFGIFDEEFHKSTWLDVTALLGSESTLGGLYDDAIVPASVLDRIVNRLEGLYTPGAAV